MDAELSGKAVLRSKLSLFKKLVQEMYAGAFVFGVSMASVATMNGPLHHHWRRALKKLEMQHAVLRSKLKSLQKSAALVFKLGFRFGFRRQDSDRMVSQQQDTARQVR